MTLVAVVLGGLIGTGARLAIDAGIPHGDDGFPWSTLLINVLGSLLLGFLVGRVWPLAPGWLRGGLGAGLLGSFTTFSAVVVSLFTLTRAGEGGLAVAYLLVSVVTGLGAAALGLRVGGSRRRPAASIGPEE